MTRPARLSFPAAICSTAMLAAIMLVLAGCGGTASLSDNEPIVFEVDHERVLEMAAENNYKFCKVLEDEICQSPDSNLYFHLPKRLDMSSLERAIIDQLRISNRGYETIVIAEYFLTIMDDKNVSYRPSFSGPDGYDQSQPFSPALDLNPGEEVDITFSQTLNEESEQVVAIAISYKLVGDLALNSVVVSYRPTSLQGLNARDEYQDGFEY